MKRFEDCKLRLPNPGPKNEPAVKPTKPLWTLDDGVTFSLLSKFVICRHRFWIRTILGYRENEGFNHRMEYGSLLHAAFEAYADKIGFRDESVMKIENMRNAIRMESLKEGLKGIGNYSEKLLQRFPESQEDILFWTKIARGQFEQYTHYYYDDIGWKHYILKEETFDFPYTLPSGRTIRLRGKIDECFYTQSGKKRIFWLQENKCKGDPDEIGITKGLHEDFQTMFYLFVLNNDPTMRRKIERHLSVIKATDSYVRRILYNVVKRPLGDKYAIRQKKSETREEFGNRVIEMIQNDVETSMFKSKQGGIPHLKRRSQSAKHFKRWDVEMADGDINNFVNETMNPLLEQVCDWWHSIKDDPFNPFVTTIPKLKPHLSGTAIGIDTDPRPNHLHYRRPMGIYDSLAGGYHGDYFDFLTSRGSDRSKLIRLDSAFPELDNPSLSS